MKKILLILLFATSVNAETYCGATLPPGIDFSDYILDDSRLEHPITRVNVVHDNNINGNDAIYAEPYKNIANGKFYRNFTRYHKKVRKREALYNPLAQCLGRVSAYMRLISPASANEAQVQHQYFTNKPLTKIRKKIHKLIQKEKHNPIMPQLVNWMNCDIKKFRCDCDADGIDPDRPDNVDEPFCPMPDSRSYNHPCENGLWVNDPQEVCFKHAENNMDINLAAAGVQAKYDKVLGFLAECQRIEKEVLAKFNLLTGNNYRKVGQFTFEYCVD